MAIKAQRMEILGINVHDVDQAAELFSRLFGVTFLSTVLGEDTVITDVPLRTGEKHHDPLFGAQKPTRIAIDTTGRFELMESHRDASANGVRNIHFKVENLDDAIAEMQLQGVRVVSNVRIGQMREAILESTDLFGVRICLVEYEGPTLIEALLAEASADPSPDPDVRNP